MVTASQTFNSFNLDDLGENAKEDVARVISTLDDVETPFMSMVKKDTAKRNYKEWLYKNHRASSAANAHEEGAEFGASVAGGDVTEPATKLGNNTQIAKVQWSVGGATDEEIEKHGRIREYLYQMMFKSDELKRDCEAILLGVNASTAAASGTPGLCAGVPNWIMTNDDLSGAGAPASAILNLGGGTHGTPTTARVDGTARALDESVLLSVIANAWISGGRPDCIISSPLNKQKMSGFFLGSSNRNADPYQDHGKSNKSGATILGAVSLYVSDFGTLELIPDRHARTTDVMILQKSLWKVAYLRKFKHEPLAKGGDYERGHMIVEFTLMALNEAGNGMFADVDQAAAMIA